MDKLRLAFLGFRHGHAYSLYRDAANCPDVTIVGACEEDPAARQQAEAEGVKITYADGEFMLDDLACDAVVLGDYFGRRGGQAVRALQAGLHVLADKPLCTHLEELDWIERLARERGLKVGLALTLRDMGQFSGARDLVRGGAIGQVLAVGFGGQHPLNRGQRPGWYFEPGKHGGTINDIAIHGVDAIRWVTGLEFASVQAARCWNALVPDAPGFGDGAQMLLSLANHAGVVGDVSYFAPSGAGYSIPQYWRMTLWGSEGVLETSATAKELSLVARTDKEPRQLAQGADSPAGYLRSFLRDVRGESAPGDLDTAQVLRSTRVTLQVQRAADAGLRDVAL
ncbi:MAG: Gfo/Idh/MocA family oxidoreductase [Chloroflexi bacterium]|nr:Gfo/Idh/MocA family oxidoreductase [Chloroflexota bacterium]